jgi:YD repeat-containing protein
VPATRWIPATGEFAETYTDLALPGRGPAPAFTRTYGSQRSPYDGPFGYGWSFSYGMYLAQDTPGSTVVSVHQEGGSVAAFTPDGSGAYTAPSRAGDSDAQRGRQLDIRPPGTGDVRLQRRRAASRCRGPQRLCDRLDLQRCGQLSAVTDPAGRAVTIAFNGQSRIGSITDPASGVVQYGYDTVGGLTSVTDPAGAITRFGYDASNLLTSVTDADGGHTSDTYDVGQRASSQQVAVVKR